MGLDVNEYSPGNGFALDVNTGYDPNRGRQPTTERWQEAWPTGLGPAFAASRFRPHFPWQRLLLSLLKATAYFPFRDPLGKRADGHASRGRRIT